MGYHPFSCGTFLVQVIWLSQPLFQICHSLPLFLVQVHIHSPEHDLVQQSSTLTESQPWLYISVATGKTSEIFMSLFRC